MDPDAIWTDLAAERPGSPGIVRRRLLPESRRNVFLGVGHPSGKRMLILAVAPAALAGVGELPGTGAVRTNLVEVSDHATEVRVELEMAEAAPVFTPFVKDVASCAAACADDAGAVSALVERFGYWRRLLSGELVSGLGADAAQGLWGELWVMRHVLHAAWADEVVASWTGWERDDNDFRRSNVAVEVKTMRGDRPAVVKITAERQFDNPGGTWLYLLALAVDAHRHGAGESLPEMVAACRDTVTGAVLLDLDQRLLGWGYSDAHRQRYLDTRYTVRAPSAFEVRDGFPRIVEAGLPDGVGSVSYRLSLDACRPFEVDMGAELPQRLAN